MRVQGSDLGGAASENYIHKKSYDQLYKWGQLDLLQITCDYEITNLFIIFFRFPVSDIASLRTEVVNNQFLTETLETSTNNSLKKFTVDAESTRDLVHRIQRSLLRCISN